MAQKKKLKLSDAIGGKLNILGFSIDIGEVLDAVQEKKLPSLERLKEAVAKGIPVIEGHLRIKSPLGDQEIRFGPVKEREE